ncbi:MAG TPA: cobalamin-independent methionine synthase II family protein [Gaiellaceae bacterium]|nr:cobalamin-independent methionine synthase II family protein [Gaiellaceae bacterium]
MAAARILTTHVGSLPRPQALLDFVFAADRGEEVDREAYERALDDAVRDVVRRQADAGVDLVSDGEMSKIGYATYVKHRVSGYELGEVPRATPADLDAYPSWRDRQVALGTAPKYERPICRGPVAYVDRGPLEADIARLKRALEEVEVEGAFMNAPSPGIVALFLPNEHYGSTEEYLDALAEALKTEYETIVEAGLVLQVDAPDLAMGRHIMYRDRSDEEFLRSVEVHVAAINQALRDVPADRVRLHLCWGNYEGPHHLDIPLGKILPLVLQARPATISFEASNPRHAHEWRAWHDLSIPEEKVLMPGALDTTTNYIEHPELVAERLVRFGELVGPDRILAGTDCGFSTWAGFGAVEADICWAKLRSLAEGAAIASERLC